MPRQPDVLEDLTPLDGSRIDIPSRIGWLLRSTRIAHGVTLRGMAKLLAEAGVRVPLATLSRLESEGQRNGAVIDGYERALGLEPGRLRAVVDSLCRTFDYAPPDLSPGLGEPDLAAYSRAVEAVLADRPSGGDWLRFAREHEDDRRFGLPTGQMLPLVARLASELNRSVGLAYVTRYEAFARLRCSAYEELVEEVVRDLVLAPGAQAVTDAMIAVSERPSTSLLEWMADLLNHPNLRITRGAALAIENMRSVGGLPNNAWPGFVPKFLEAYELAADDLPRRVTFTKLFKNLPPQTRALIQDRLSARFEHVHGPEGWDQGRRNAHLELAREVAETACTRLGQPPQPMLARMLFEILFDFRGTRSGTSGILLLGSPFGDAVHPLLLDLAANGPDETTRLGAQGVVSAIQPADSDPDVLDWLESDDDGLVDTAYLLLGNAGRPMPDAALEAGLAREPVSAIRALASAGMSQHPRLPDLAADFHRDQRVRTAAAWWLREGGRVAR